MGTLYQQQSLLLLEKYYFLAKNKKEFMVSQINPQMLQEWKKDGEIIAIWRCENCFRKIPLYKTDNELINSIYLSFAQFEKDCPKCKMRGKPIVKKKIIREIILLEKYEGIIEDDEEDLFLSVNRRKI